MPAEGGAPAVDDLRERLVGLQFPEGVSEIGRHEAWLGHQAMAAPGDDAGELHPLWPMVVGMRGMGLSVSQLSELAEMKSEDSLLFGELKITQDKPLAVETKYVVQGEIIGLDRREGRRAGVFDVVTFELKLFTQGNASAEHAVATVRNSFVFVRRT